VVEQKGTTVAEGAMETILKTLLEVVTRMVLQAVNDLKSKQKPVSQSNLRTTPTEESMDRRTEQLAASITKEFNRANSGGVVETIVMDHVLWVVFRKGTEEATIKVPLPVVNEKGVELVTNKDVVRVGGDYWLEREQRRVNYHEIVSRLFCSDVNDIFPGIESGDPLVAKIARSFGRGQLVYMTGTLQRLVNDVVNRMPLFETDMNSWAMNHRIIIIDPKFDQIRDPNKRLDYQVEKNAKYYERYGWTAIGLSDGVLSDKNYLLTMDLRNTIPFGAFHNPQRNLYSTLSMKGDELPRIKSISMEKLLKRGITRKGWNVVTAILDTPLNFEDQILVDNSLRSIAHTAERRFVIYGDKLMVKEGESIKEGDTIGFSNDGVPVKMNLRCDEAKVVRVRRDIDTINSQPISIWVVLVEGKRFIREGTKFSNLHGNKGVIKFADLGYKINPKTGELVKIHVMVSAKSINKRKNFGQILEVLLNNVRPGNDPIVIADDYSPSGEKVKGALNAAGLPDDGTCVMTTPFGDFEGICGEMFWGVTKDPEDQSWDERKTERTNNRALRVSGLKLSHVELKALTTRFGPGNPILKEIMEHAQGVEILRDEFRILHSAKGELSAGYPVVDAKDVRSVDTRKGLFHPLSSIKGTIVDEDYFTNGFVLRLPIYFQALVSKDNPDSFEWGLPQQCDWPEGTYDEYQFNTIFVPNALLRRCWKHPSGLWGLNVLGSHVNAIVNACHRYERSKDLNDANTIARHVGRYFRGVSTSMGSKTGELSVYGMSVRYPFSARATATLSDNLPKNTVEIHRDMAAILGVKTGDVVLAERFPCLGFMSIRPQYVRVTDDPQCKHVIRVSGNSLVSMTLDFDGDTLFLAALHSPQAIQLLHKEMKSPNRVCEEAIEALNSRKVPEYNEMTLDDFEIVMFGKPTVEEHSEIVRKATGVKSHTGPVIALAYNLMRIVEANVPFTNIEDHAYLEMLLDFLGNTVFKQKHGIKSLQEEATDAVCMGDVDKMVALGFEHRPSKMLCDLIRKEALSIGVNDLVWYHTKAKERGWSKIINRIVREKNKVYFATRATLGPYNLLQHMSSPAVDLPSKMLFDILRTPREQVADKIEALKAERMRVPNLLKTAKMKDVFEALSGIVDKLLIKPKMEELNYGLYGHQVCGESQGAASSASGGGQ